MRGWGITAALALAGCVGVRGQDPAPSTLALIGTGELLRGATLNGIAIGGLSGLDRAPDGSYRAITDDRGGNGRPPRVYRLAIALDPSAGRIRIEVKGQARLRHADGSPFPADRVTVDPEAIRVAPDGRLYWSSEGVWSADPAARVQPALYEADADGRILLTFALPAPYLYRDDATRGARANGVLEGLALTPRGTVFTINEAPAFEDKPAYAPATTPNPLRLTSFDPHTGRATRQYAYVIPDGRYSVSELLAVDERRFLTIERVLPFDDVRGVEARIVLSTIAAGSSDVLRCPALPACRARPLTRRVLLDLPMRWRGIRIDNLEAMTWGPPLPDGRRTLILASDDNFNARQITQILALAVPM